MNDPFTFINYVFDLHHDLIASNKMSYSNGSIYMLIHLEINSTRRKSQGNTVYNFSFFKHNV